MHSILHQIRIDATTQRVFEAFTSAAGLSSWWTLQAAGTPELGAVYRFNFGPDFDWRAEVVHIVPGTEMTWQMTEAMDDWLPTQFGFSLTDAVPGCTLRFFHRNWPHNGDHFAMTNSCWGHLLRGLKDYAERGVVVLFEDRQ